MKPKIKHVLNDFIKEKRSASELVLRVKCLEAVRGTRNKGLHSKYVEKIIGLSFMSLVSAFEVLLEESFVRFLCTANIPAEKLYYGKCKDIGSAYKLISGEPKYDIKKKYLAFSDIDWLGNKSMLFLKKPTPYDLIFSNPKVWINAQKIRNRIAHKSPKCISDFKVVALTMKFGGTSGHKLSNGYSVGAFLKEKPVASHSIFPSGIDITKDVFSAFAETLELFAKNIIKI